MTHASLLCGLASLTLIGCEREREVAIAAPASVARAVVATPSVSRSTTAAPHRLMRPEQAPPLEAPRTLPAASAPLRPGDRVVGLWLDGEARAYPLNLLAYHRTVGDRVAGRRVTIVYSPLTDAALCLRDERRYHASGQVLENDELIADERGVLRSLLLESDRREPANAERGTATGRAPCAILRWSRFRELKPHARVAWPARAPLGFDYRRDPWVWYRADDAHLVAPLRFMDLRLPGKQPVLGVSSERETRAYPLPKGGTSAANVWLGGEPVLVLLDGEGELAIAYSRRLGGRTLRLELERGSGRLELREQASGSRFNLLGEAIAGPLVGGRLALMPGTRSLFFAWAALHQGTLIENVRLARRNDDEEG